MNNQPWVDPIPADLDPDNISRHLRGRVNTYLEIIRLVILWDQFTNSELWEVALPAVFTNELTLYHLESDREKFQTDVEECLKLRKFSRGMVHEATARCLYVYGTHGYLLDQVGAKHHVTTLDDGTISIRLQSGDRSLQLDVYENSLVDLIVERGIGYDYEEEWCLEDATIDEALINVVSFLRCFN